MPNLSKLPHQHSFSFLIGTLGGGIVGLVGWGGAQIIIPGMTHPLAGSLSQLSASGVSLCSLSVSALSSGFKFLKEDSVCVSTAAAIAIPSIVSARVGTKLASKMSGDVLALVFHGLSAIMIPTHCIVQHYAAKKRNVEDDDYVEDLTGVIPSHVHAAHIHHDDDDDIIDDKKTEIPIAQHSCFGLLSGALSALMGVGGLPLTMTYLTLQTDLPHHLVQGTAICSVAPGTVTSALSRIHVVPIQSAAIVTLAAMFGGLGGAQIALWLEEESLRYLYMGSLVVLGGQSVARSVYSMRSILVRKRYW